MEQTRSKTVLKWALTVGIVIVLNLFFSVAIETVYPQPEYSDFCEVRQVREIIGTEAACVAIGGQWNPNIPVKPGDPEGFCFEDFTCAQEYGEAQKEYARDVFVALIVLGALSMGGSFIAGSAPAVAAGLSYGGVLTFVIAALRYWGEAGDLIRLVIVGAALVALIGIGIKKFKE